MNESIIFGPVPSRRLGISIGINNIPPKYCSYGCVYCQLGRTSKMTISRREFYNPELIYKQLKEKINNLTNNKIDYLTLVADGEPTLDINLEEILNKLKSLNYKVAVITNSSLLDDPKVRKELLTADLISVKVDSVNRKIWSKIDRPHGKIDLDLIMEGIEILRKEFKGIFLTETMLVNDLNTKTADLTKTAEYIGKLDPDIAYLSIPTRPPSEKWVIAPDIKTINKAYQIFSKKIKNVEYLTGYEGNKFTYSGNFTKDLLSITAVHPMREDAVKELLLKDEGNNTELEKLLSAKEIIVTKYNDEKFYLRNLRKA